MPRRWRSILATVLVLGFAVFAYLHSAPATIDLSAMPRPADDEHPALTDLPPDVRKLDGQLVAVDGYMIPMDQAENITKFAVVPKLNFSDPSPPPLTQTMVANCQPTSYTPDNIRVYGRLRVRAATDDGYVVALYDMDVEQVVPIYTGPRARWPWAVIGIVTVIASFFLRRALIRRRLHRTGHCVRCGYDLRATPARCPECGLVTIQA